MRRRFPWWLVVLVFVALPLLEIYVIIEVGHVIGAWWTILLLFADAVVGAWLIKHEGRRTWRALREAVQAGRLPANELADGILVLVGGTLMITPGFVTDALGVLCVLPLTRPIGRRLLAGVVGRRLLSGMTVTGTAQRPGTGPSGDGRVVRGEVIDE